MISFIVSLWLEYNARFLNRKNQQKILKKYVIEDS